jgi:uncharacterized membrane protein
MYVLSRMIVKSRRIEVTGEGAERDAQYRRLNLIMLGIAMYFIALLHAATTYAVVKAGPEGALLGGPLLLGAFLFPILILGVFVIRFSFKYARPREDMQAIGDKTPDECWYAGGLFYFNRDDSAILVEKRFGFGYTFNMARMESWLLLGVLLAVPVMLSLLS